MTAPSEPTCGVPLGAPSTRTRRVEPSETMATWCHAGRRSAHEVLRGMMYLSPRVSRTLVQAYLAKSELPPDPLTPREREVLQLVAEGKTTKEVAEALGISVKTAESHRAHILRKLDTPNIAGIVRYAIRRGLVKI